MATTTIARFYPIGTPGKPWGETEKLEWLSRQRRHRQHADDVVAVVERELRAQWQVVDYGRVQYGEESYPLLALLSRPWDESLPIALVTGGVHGYETSGVHGALRFALKHATTYTGRINVIVVPCVSPWGYERIHRWNADAVDPNRSFREPGSTQEAAGLHKLLAPYKGRILIHIDLHETTDTDESEFTPALAARDGTAYEPGIIPDGFYLVGDAENPQPEFQQAIIAAVAKVTHIAPADAKGEIIGTPVVAPGVINIPVKKLGLCAGATDAAFTTTTEVYPDSPKASPEVCNEAQVAAATAAIDFALVHKS